MPYPGMPGFWHSGPGWGEIIVSAIVFVVVVLIIVFIIRALAGPRRGRYWVQPHSDALEIAKERYASGEITKEQFEQLRKDLLS